MINKEQEVNAEWSSNVSRVVLRDEEAKRDDFDYFEV
jgi:hypothetical protein